jgi:ferredoxin-NADP reductase
MNVKESIARLQRRKPWDSHSEWLECTMILDDTADVKTFVFQTQDPSWFHFLPGQFVTLELEIDGKKVSRCYTIASSPSRPLCLSISVKALKDGLVSNWLHKTLKPGDRIKAYGPSGIFSFHNHLADKYLFLSGGVGITPMLSMVRWLFDFGQHTDVTFIHCSQTPADIIARNEVETISARLPEFKVAYVCERPNPYGAWTGYTGRLNQLMLQLISPDFFEREVFCCGPEPFMHAVRDVLHSAGFDMHRYHEESFQTPIHDESDIITHDDDVIIDDSHKSKVNFAESGQVVKCRESDTVLAVSKKAGLHIPSACQFGVCGSCRVRKVSGDVHMVHNGGISDEEIEEGYILACCSHPIGEVVIEY